MYVVMETAPLAVCVHSLQLPNRSGCNGVKNICTKKYNEVAYATMHNAFATTQDGFFFAQHRACMRSALVHGIRGFMLDVHLTMSNDLKLCHSACWLGSISLHDTLQMFGEFRALNPREIVTIFIEAGFDGRRTVDSTTKAKFQSLLRQSFQLSGLTPFMQIQASIDDTWPSLTAMIEEQKQVMVFVDAEFFCDGAVAPWFHCSKHFVVQTQYGSATPQQLSEECSFRRTWNVSQELTVINHFTIVGSLGINTGSTTWFGDVFNARALQNINHDPFLSNRVLSCSRCVGRFIHFVAVDFWESSDVLSVTSIINSNMVPYTYYPHRPDAAFCVNSTHTPN